MCVQRKKINQTTVRHSTLTHVVDDEALALAEDEPGWIWVEGDGQVGGGGGELEGAAASDVAPQDTSRDLIAVGDGQHVAVADVQPEDSEKIRVRERERESAAPDKSRWLRASRVDSRLCGRRRDLRG